MSSSSISSLNSINFDDTTNDIDVNQQNEENNNDDENRDDDDDENIENEENNENEVEVEEIMDNVLESTDDSIRYSENHWFQNWSPEIPAKELEIREKKGHNTIIYIAEASLLPGTNQSPVILFRFRGQAFLLQ